MEWSEESRRSNRRNPSEDVERRKRIEETTRLGTRHTTLCRSPGTYPKDPFYVLVTGFAPTWIPSFSYLPSTPTSKPWDTS